MQPETDCVVVGAGLVGSIAALALARQGRPVTVLERRAALNGTASGDMRALVLSAASVELLRRYEVWPRIADAACAVRAIRVSDAGGFGRLEMRADEINVDALGWACPADRLLAAFNAALIEHSRISVMWSARCTAVAVSANHARVSYHAAGKEHALSARLVVGADGAHSVLRAACGIEVERLDYGQDAIVANLEVSAPCAATAYEHFTRRGPLALIPTGGRRYVSIQCLDRAGAELAWELDDAAYLAMLERRFGPRLGQFTALGPRRRHALARQRARRPGAERVILVGNAANTVHPNAAQGLNLGLRDVAALVASLPPGGDPGSPGSIAAYCRARRCDHARTGAFTDVLAQAFRSRLPGVTCARRTALNLFAHVAPLRRRLMRDASGLGLLTAEFRVD